MSSPTDDSPRPVPTPGVRCVAHVHRDVAGDITALCGGVLEPVWSPRDVADVLADLAVGIRYVVPWLGGPEDVVVERRQGGQPWLSSHHDAPGSNGLELLTPCPQHARSTRRRARSPGGPLAEDAARAACRARHPSMQSSRPVR